MTRPKAAISWSGGKDCCLALMRAWSAFDVVVMLTMFDEEGERSRSHGLRPDVVNAQAQRLGIPNLAERCSWSSYEDGFRRLLQQAAGLGCELVIFGDIFEDDHRRWTERVARAEGLVAHQPIWGEATHALVREFLARNGAATLVTVRDTYLDSSWLGRPLTLEAVEEFERIGVDPCGERGEYHTVVTACPLFASPLHLDMGVSVARGGCHAIDVRPISPSVVV